MAFRRGRKMTEGYTEEIQKIRKTRYQVHPLILNRWSPRSMTGEAMSDEEIFSLFEAARWAPSAYNGQPWRFLYAKRETPSWDIFFNLLVDFNKQWCKNGAVLGLSISRKTFEKNEKPAPTHAFDTGAAWENLCLEGTYRGYVVHGMQGFDYERARSELSIPDTYEVLAMFALGKRAPKSALPLALQEKEAPSERKAIQEFVFEGKFPQDRK